MSYGLEILKANGDLVFTSELPALHFHSAHYESSYIMESRSPTGLLPWYLGYYPVQFPAQSVPVVAMSMSMSPGKLYTISHIQDMGSGWWRIYMLSNFEYPVPIFVFTDPKYLAKRSDYGLIAQKADGTKTFDSSCLPLVVEDALQTTAPATVQNPYNYYNRPSIFYGQFGHNVEVGFDQDGYMAQRGYEVIANKPYTWHGGYFVPNTVTAHSTNTLGSSSSIPEHPLVFHHAVEVINHSSLHHRKRRRSRTFGEDDIYEWKTGYATVCRGGVTRLNDSELGVGWIPVNWDGAYTQSGADNTVSSLLPWTGISGTSTNTVMVARGDRYQNQKKIPTNWSGISMVLPSKHHQMYHNNQAVSHDFHARDSSNKFPIIRALENNTLDYSQYPNYQNVRFPWRCSFHPDVQFCIYAGKKWVNNSGTRSGEYSNIINSASSNYTVDLSFASGGNGNTDPRGYGHGNVYNGNLFTLSNWTGFRDEYDTSTGVNVAAGGSFADWRVNPHYTGDPGLQVQPRYVKKNMGISSQSNFTNVAEEFLYQYASTTAASEALMTGNLFNLFYWSPALIIVYQGLISYVEGSYGQVIYKRDIGNQSLIVDTTPINQPQLVITGTNGSEVPNESNGSAYFVTTRTTSNNSFGLPNFTEYDYYLRGVGVEYDAPYGRVTLPFGGKTSYHL